MYDGVQFVAFGNHFCDQLSHQLRELRRSVDVGGEIRYEHGWIDNFDVTIKPGSPEKHATFRGSLHRYVHTNNNGLFTFQEVCAAVDKFCTDCNLNAANNNIIHRIEFGVNIPHVFPKAIIDAAILYNGRTPNRHPRMKIKGKRTENPYKEWEFDQYSVKLYGKSKNTIRLEFHINDMRKAEVLGLGISNLQSLKDPNTAGRCIQQIYDAIDSFLFIPSDCEGVLPEDLAPSWESYRGDCFWEGFQNRQDKSRTKMFILDTIARYGLIDWPRFLKNQIATQATRILSVKSWIPSEKIVTISTLGLNGETVAESDDECDRQAENNIHPDGGISIYTFHNNHILSDRHHLSESLYRHAGDYGCRVTGCHRARAPPAAVYKTNVL